MTLFPKCYNRPILPPFPFCGPWAPREAKCPAEHGHLGMQTPDPGICPTLAQPHSCPRRGPSARQQRLRWGAGWPLAPLPPQAPRPGSFHPAAQLPAHPPGPRHQSTPGSLLPLSFLPSSSLPNLSLFFFLLLSLFQHVITVETKSAGTMRALMAAPSRPLPPRCVPALFPPAQGWNRCQRSPANKQEEPDKPGTQ